MIMEQEKIYRTANVSLVKAIPLYPLPLRQNQKGHAYHSSFLELFPDKVKEPFQKALDDEMILCSFRKLPYMMKKENLFHEACKRTP